MLEYLHSFSKLEFDKVLKHIQRYTLSDLGREHLETLTPSTNLAEIQANLRLVSEMKTILESEEYPPLSDFKDIRSSLQRSTIENFILTSQELHQIVEVVESSAKISSYFVKRKNSYPAVYERVGRIQIDKILAYNIRAAIDDDANVKDSASKELSSIRRQIVDKKLSLRKSLESILKSVAGKDWIQEEIVTTRDGRMVIPVKIEHKNRLPGFIHSTSASGATVFIEPTVTLEVNNEIRTLEFQERREIEKILQHLTQQVCAGKDTLIQNIQILGELDFIHAKAKYSIEMIGNEPSFHDNEGIKIVQGYHPILLLRHGIGEVVPLDFEMKESLRTIIITGPNAGGKSVTMKTIALLCLLAQSGCHIPASSESRLPIFEDIFAEIGDEQSIENDLSSFSSHLKNLQLIISRAGSKSLVLIDEICSGTDPGEGASIAAAILEKLTSVNCLTIVTTHHGSLKAFAFENSHMENAAMEFNQETLQPTYKFILGVPGSSYAIEMAEKIHVSEDIIVRSKILKGEPGNKLEELIINLEKRSHEMRDALARVEEEKMQLEGLIQDYSQKLSVLERDTKHIKTQALEEARQIIEDANSTLEKAVQEIREHAADRQSVVASKQEIQQLKSKIDSSINEERPSVEEQHFPIGATVRLKNSNATGEVFQELENNYYTILVGEMRLRISSKDIEFTSIGKVIHHKTNREPPISEIKHEVDLRGMYGDEAIIAVEKIIDDAILHGLHRIDIIHGKGTGALRKRVAEFLKMNVSVKSYRLGEWNEGGSGVTVVELL